MPRQNHRLEAHATFINHSGHPVIRILLVEDQPDLHRIIREMLEEEIVAAHGGEMTIESQLGTGTTVRVTLPLAGESEQDVAN